MDKGVVLHFLFFLQCPSGTKGFLSLIPMLPANILWTPHCCCTHTHSPELPALLSSAMCTPSFPSPEPGSKKALHKIPPDKEVHPLLTSGRLCDKKQSCHTDFKVTAALRGVRLCRVLSSYQIRFNTWEGMNVIQQFSLRPTQPPAGVLSESSASQAKQIMIVLLHFPQNETRKNSFGMLGATFLQKAVLPLTV